MDENKKIKNSFSNATKKQISQNKLMTLLKILPDTLDNVLKLNKKLTYKGGGGSPTQMVKDKQNKKKQTSILNKGN